jgi:hypothetical protein
VLPRLLREIHRPIRLLRRVQPDQWVCIAEVPDVTAADGAAETTAEAGDVAMVTATASVVIVACEVAEAWEAADSCSAEC